MRISRDHKIQNPALHLFRVTGFLDAYEPSLILFPSLGGLRRKTVTAILPNFVYKNQQRKSMEIGTVRIGYWIPLVIAGEELTEQCLVSFLVDIEPVHAPSPYGH
jgi:hypothetical protein